MTQNQQPKALAHPFWDMIGRYQAVLGAAWTHRAELAGPRRMADELAFLPAAISLQETPIHPAPRRLAWCLMLLFILALMWSIIGTVDIVAIAPGQIIVSERTKIIQPLENSVVRRVLVKDGERVRAGQILLELDPTTATADMSSVAELLSAAVSEEQRTAALLKALTGGASPPASELAGNMAAHAQLQAEWQEIKAKLSKLDSETARRQAEVQTEEANVGKLTMTVPMAQDREADFKRLVGQGFMSGHASQDKTRERVELERDLLTARARLAEARSASAESIQAKAAYRSETLRLLYDRNALAASKHHQLNADRSKAVQREQLTRLTAPVDGVIQQLAIHTTGGVVTAAQPLMIVVPDSVGVSAQVSILNQDIGFVNAGQLANVKLETFPYTKYGTVDATVEVLTADAVTDEKKGAFYLATLKFKQTYLIVDGKRVALIPGMNVTAEIKTGKRRIIEYLMAPVQRAGQESLRER
ncbi:HlyD family type I secretion periplasmic adaptor subunit [Massilia scottii]|uniref:HlyD family type I secretion periplasmic adaptor subunit n=1 Tax=Massilia scottii TaxID=3057166 RepID=UPI0027966560|nr:HlyD family type I secretion periplasmic adaptor subunit [Massilia sp. CCM 9029]MDQ1833425.1 HlyD family type I secretion periplasmic adaptor subunit [Massilia sp. CCM 9029]